jgi:hypothetical protein
MWNCRHAECHNPGNCVICSKTGVTWCPHQNCGYENPELPNAPTEQSEPATPPGITWTPTLAGNLLKFAFVVATVAGSWWLLCSSTSLRREERDPLSPNTEAPAPDFSPWEPES